METKITLITTKHRNVFTVKLNHCGLARIIGTLDTAGNGCFITDRKENHRLRASNSLGISFQLLKNNSIPFENIVINYGGRKLITTRSYFIAKGQYLKFKNFDAQIFLGINMFGSSKAEQFEKETMKAIATPEKTVTYDLFSEVAQ